MTQPKNTPVQLSGGAGFDLEDHIAARFFLAMLRGEAMFGLELGIASQVDFQVGESGWLLDDLLLTANDQSGKRTRVAVSVKTAKQVSAKNGFAATFTNAVWQQWTGASDGCFDKKRDLLCLAVANIGDSVWKAWHAFQREALDTSTERFLERVASATPTKRAIFQSLVPDVGKYPEVDKSDAVELMRRIRLRKYDFQEVNSGDAADAIVICRSLMADRSGVDLWDALKLVAKDHRIVGGTVDLEKLTRCLVERGFHLKQHPNFANDWEKLAQLSASAQGLIRGYVGNRLELSRTASRETLRQVMATSSAVVLLGPSGVGKSALLTRELSEFEETVVWLNVGHFRYASVAEQKSVLGLEHGLGRILSSSTSARNTLVVDAVEAFSDAELELLATTLNDAKLAKAAEWTLVFTSQTHAWDAVQTALYAKCGLHPTGHELGPVDDKDVDHLLRECGITQFRHNANAKRLFGNLKILDWVVCAISARPPDKDEQPMSIGSILDIVWQYWIGQDERRHPAAKLLQYLGAEQAATFNRGVPFDALDYGATELLSALEGRDVLRIQNETVFFAHDLIGDWIRFQALFRLEKMEDALRGYADNPVWHNAIRIYGQSLLDQVGTDQPQWESMQESVRDESPQGDIVGDLLLDSVWSHPNAYSILIKRREWFLVDNPDLFQRIAKRFLLGATVADPRAAALSPDEDMRLLLETSMRIPLWLQWPPLLGFFHDSIANVVRHTPESVAKICALWLQHAPVKTQDGAPYPLRKEAATVGLALAEEVRARDEEHSWFQGKEKTFYEAALLAAHDLPDAVGQFALEMVQRRPMNDALKHRLAEYRKQQLLAQIVRQKKAPKRKRPPTPISLSAFRGDRRDPWPHGPAHGVNDAFRDAAWASNGLSGLMACRPRIAAEIILALCIEAPRYEYEDDSDLQKPGLAFWRSSFPDSYFAGPFLSFLQINSDVALNLILELVNFVTNRWVARGQRQNPNAEPPSISIPVQGKEKRWIGNWNLFGWFRGVGGGDCPVTCALMALEQWLYLQLEADQDVSGIIETILNNARSVAFAGMLCSVGKKHPELFDGSLRPLLGAADVYEWDYALTQNNNLSGMSSMLWAQHGEIVFELLREWHAMPHRGLGLRDIVQDRLVRNPDLQTFLRERIAVWREYGSNHEYLCAQLDFQNYAKAVDSSGAAYWQLSYPPELERKAAKELNDVQHAQLVMGLPYNCQQLFDQEAGLADDQLDAFAKTLRALADSDPNSDPFIEYKKPAAVLAGFGVLMEHHKEWLSSQPDILKWGKAYLSSVLNSPPQEHEFDSPVAVDPTGWESWAARLCVLILSEEVENTRWREAVARLTMGAHYLTTGIVLLTAFERRNLLGDDFQRLLNLAKIWSAVEPVWGRGDSPRSVRRRQQVIDAYRSKTLPAAPLSLQRVAAAGRRFHTRQRIRQYHRFGDEDMAAVAERIQQSHVAGLNWPLVMQSMSWLPDRLTHVDKAVRTLALQAFSDLTDYCLSIAPRDPEEKSRDDIPSELIRWWLGRVATLSMELPPDESITQWQPIMKLGVAAHYWVDAFIGGFFLEGAKAAASPEVFRQRWRALVEYTLNSETWRKQGYLDYRRCRIVLDVMGLRVGTTIVGDPAYQDVIASLLPLYKKWAESWLHDSEAANALSAFLLKPSAASLVPDGIVWLSDAISKYRDCDWRENGLSSNLATVLQIGWNNHRSEFTRPGERRDAFFALMTLLAQRQVETAIVLQHEVGSATADE